MQAEGDSLTGLSEVPTSQTPSLVPNTGGWYGEPNQAMDLQPQEPGLTQLRHKLGLPLQRPAHQAAAVQQTHHGNAAKQGAEDLSAACQPEVDRHASCSYEVSHVIIVHFVPHIWAHYNLLKSFTSCAAAKASSEFCLEMFPFLQSSLGLLLQELTLSDTALLLRAYKQASHLKQKEILRMTHSSACDDDVSSEMLGRFSHYTSGSLRLADVQQVLQDLQQISATKIGDMLEKPV